MQETYMKALKGFGSFQQGTNFRAWMFRILRNTFQTSRTGLKAVTSLDEEEETSCLLWRPLKPCCWLGLIMSCCRALSNSSPRIIAR